MMYTFVYSLFLGEIFGNMSDIKTYIFVFLHCFLRHTFDNYYLKLLFGFLLYFDVRSLEWK